MALAGKHFKSILGANFTSWFAVHDVSPSKNLVQVQLSYDVAVTTRFVFPRRCAGTLAEHSLVGQHGRGVLLVGSSST